MSLHQNRSIQEQSPPVRSELHALSHFEVHVAPSPISNELVKFSWLSRNLDRQDRNSLRFGRNRLGTLLLYQCCCQQIASRGSATLVAINRSQTEGCAVAKAGMQVELLWQMTYGRNIYNMTCGDNNTAGKNLNIHSDPRSAKRIRIQQTRRYSQR